MIEYRMSVRIPRFACAMSFARHAYAVFDSCTLADQRRSVSYMHPHVKAVAWKELTFALWLSKRI